MPAVFLCRSAVPNDGIRKVHLSLDRGQPNDVYLNVTSEVLAAIFPHDVREGDEWRIHAELVSRVGRNGRKR